MRYMAFQDLKSKSGVFAYDGRHEFVQAINWVVRDREVERGDIKIVRSGRKAFVELSEESSVGGYFCIKIVHSFVETSVSGRFHLRAFQVVVVEDLE